MKHLQDLLHTVRSLETYGSTDRRVSAVVADSRKAKGDALFVAIKGTETDGHAFIQEAVQRGASTVLCETMPLQKAAGVTYVRLKSTTAALGVVAANFYGNPSRALTLVGITGTNGKTTTMTLLHQLVSDMGYPAGLLTTVVNKIEGEAFPATHTTPDPIELNSLLSRMVDAGCTYCFMEVSSHAIHQHRIAGLSFRIAAFSNITHDHLDYHKTFDNYIAVKKQFFDHLPSTATAIVNRDDPNGQVMVQQTRAKVKTLAIKRHADYKAKIVENTSSGLLLQLHRQEVSTPLMGAFNAYNLLMVFAIARELQLDEVEVLTGISRLKPVEGRFDSLRSRSGILGIVDYAHTPDALKNVLSTIRSIRTKREQLITVLGCGGDRDAAKRPLMGTLATTLSDKVIFTSDNPRSEDPAAIIDDMKATIPTAQREKTATVIDRAAAIEAACSAAQPGDIVLIAGKGHEKYQEIKGKRYPFDDRNTLQNTLKLLQK